jgi:hypothetical protein
MLFFSSRSRTLLLASHLRAGKKRVRPPLVKFTAQTLKQLCLKTL